MALLRDSSALDGCASDAADAAAPETFERADCREGSLCGRSGLSSSSSGKSLTQAVLELARRPSLVSEAAFGELLLAPMDWGTAGRGLDTGATKSIVALVLLAPVDCGTAGRGLGAGATKSMVALLKSSVGASWRFGIREGATRGRRAGLDPALCSLDCQSRLGLDGPSLGGVGINSWHGATAIQSAFPDIRVVDSHGEKHRLALSDGPPSDVLARPERVGLKLGVEALLFLGDCGHSLREALLSARSRAAAHLEADGA
mmetsp:Transcript_98156/g.286271  ORF Transcript_98156/g.286271 Transcript_98156/m.286271 type:complete len:259 (+) Transcript_98156:253-1029(+)